MSDSTVHPTTKFSVKIKADPLRELLSYTVTRDDDGATLIRDMMHSHGATGEAARRLATSAAIAAVRAYGIRGELSSSEFEQPAAGAASPEQHQAWCRRSIRGLHFPGPCTCEQRRPAIVLVDGKNAELHESPQDAAVQMARDVLGHMPLDSEAARRVVDLIGWLEQDWDVARPEVRRP